MQSPQPVAVRKSRSRYSCMIVAVVWLVSRNNGTSSPIVRAFSFHVASLTSALTRNQVIAFILALVLCLMLGTAAMPHVLTRYYTTPSVSEAAALLAAGRPHEMHALRLEKHRLKGTDGRNATVSVAEMIGLPMNTPEPLFLYHFYSLCT